MSLRPCLFALLAALPALPVAAAERVDLEYRVRLSPEHDQAQVQLVLEKGEAIRQLDFRLGERFANFQGDGQWQEADGRGVWAPSPGKASLSWTVRISDQRDNGRYDARITPDWALFRGDDLVPAAHLDQADGVQLVSRLQFELPESWTGVETGWPRVGKNRFRIDNPERLFDRPTGWILAGKLGTRRARLGETDVAVSAPVGEGVRRMDILTLLTFVWPQVQSVFPRDPQKLLVVGAGDPMWRGGLSAPNSVYLHADRPLVSENGTSSLVHELVHVFSRIRDAEDSDWISEGIAEYYAIELVRRAGGMTEERYQQVRKKLVRWSRDVKSLRSERASGAVTARAVLLLQDLDREIRKRTQGRHSLDDLSRGLMRLDTVTTRDLVAIAESLIGGPSQVLDTRLLR